MPGNNDIISIYHVMSYVLFQEMLGPKQKIISEIKGTLIHQPIYLLSAIS